VQDNNARVPINDDEAQQSQSNCCEAIARVVTKQAEAICNKVAGAFWWLEFVYDWTE
jgi:hypothetical protein